MQHPSCAVEFEWDEHNERELREHRVFPHEVEEVFWNGPAFRRNKRRAAGTWSMTGRTNEGRRLVVFVLWADEDESILRAVTGWDAP